MMVTAAEPVWQCTLVLLNKYADVRKCAVMEMSFIDVCTSYRRSLSLLPHFLSSSSTTYASTPTQFGPKH